ncbi:MAG: hypothetical protein QOJ99_3197 [Bryobacterales bacterium]|jgi:hypothetical protein|nr:hypothetical protein [Bryobacterales bacterium]
MIVTKKHLSRRALLRGFGTALALPMLDAMVPVFHNAAAAPASGAGSAAPMRLAFHYVPNGVNYKEWRPVGEGSVFEFSRILKPIEKYRKDLMVLSGLDIHPGNALGDGGGDHARAGASYLTGVHPHKTAGADIHGGVSADQIAAQVVGKNTRLASLELGCEDSRTVGNCDTGYSCAYTNSISWRTPTLPLPPETNPRVIFERLFGTDDLKVDAVTKARRTLLRKSVLDVVGERTQKLLGEVGPSDRRKLDEYMTGVREVERRIQIAETDTHQFKPDLEKPTGVPIEFGEYMKLMFDLQILAFQADLTRVSTFMYGREGSVRTYNEIGVADPHHPITHHRNLPELLEKIAKINTYHVELFSYFLDRLKATQDGDGTLLDHSMVMYGGALCDGNQHGHENVPTVLVGRGNGRFTPGRHLVYPKGTPITNLYLALLDRMDVHPESIGDSNGMLEHLTDL